MVKLTDLGMCPGSQDRYKFFLHFWVPGEELQRCLIHFWALRGDRRARIIIPTLSPVLGTVPGSPISDPVPTSYSLPADFWNVGMAVTFPGGLAICTH